MAGVLREILRGLVEGSDESRVVETPLPSVAPEVDVAGLVGQVRLLRREMAGVVERVSRLEEELEEEEGLEEPYRVEGRVPEGLMEEDLRLMRELREWCEAVYKSRVDNCLNARSDRCALKRGAPFFYCALLCVNYKVAGAREPILL